jgi:hypothetical protein
MPRPLKKDFVGKNKIPMMHCTFDALVITSTSCGRLLGTSKHFFCESVGVSLLKQLHNGYHVDQRPLPISQVSE